MRTFIAIEIPEEIKSALAALQNELRRTAAVVSWTKPENIHLTLKFLGEIEEQKLGQIERACLETAAETASFTLNLSDAGVFPHHKQPRVIWVGLGGETASLTDLQSRLDQRLSALGFERETRPFQAHLTIGRVKAPKGSRELMAQLINYRPPALSFVVAEIVLMRSQLHPAGSIYTPLARTSFGQR